MVCKVCSFMFLLKCLNQRILICLNNGYYGKWSLAVNEMELNWICMMAIHVLQNILPVLQQRVCTKLWWIMNVYKSQQDFCTHSLFIIILFQDYSVETPLLAHKKITSFALSHPFLMLPPPLHEMLFLLCNINYTELIHPQALDECQMTAAPSLAGHDVTSWHQRFPCAILLSIAAMLGNPT